MPWLRQNQMLTIEGKPCIRWACLFTGLLRARQGDIGNDLIAYRKSRTFESWKRRSLCNVFAGTRGNLETIDKLHAGQGQL